MSATDSAKNKIQNTSYPYLKQQFTLVLQSADNSPITPNSPMRIARAKKAYNIHLIVY